MFFNEHKDIKFIKLDHIFKIKKITYKHRQLLVTINSSHEAQKQFTQNQFLHKKISYFKKLCQKKKVVCKLKHYCSISLEFVHRKVCWQNETKLKKL